MDGSDRLFDDRNPGVRPEEPIANVLSYTAGLGLARAVAVVSVLSRSPLLAGYKLIPISGAQLVNTDETLAIDGFFSGDVRERRRIEIRLRKSSPHDSSLDASPDLDALTRPPSRAKSLVPDIMRPYVAPSNVMHNH